ncbi:tetratricopeptide repeat protein [uncultured Bdellovibrio sp.]|uniref:tetratricopeptide repeat protein n=1 Tax=Bdellovibrio sp. HCB-162 TaxID=3394234 RepID=UPI0025E659AD|nr:hypothetical protein [uncultured Bdellovibrio sp.]
MSTGFSMMDQGNYDEAIAYFTKLSAMDPHYHVKMALASAYAGRAGVKIEQIYSFVVVKNIAPQNLRLTGLSIDQQTSQLMNTLARYSEQWSRVPDVSASGRRDLQSALKVLEAVPEPGARLYSATLRVVLLKSSVLEGTKNWKIQNKSQVCTDDLRPFFDWGLRIVDGLLFLLEDLRGAFPEREKDYQDISNRLSQIKKDAAALPWPRENLCF